MDVISTTVNNQPEIASLSGVLSSAHMIETKGYERLENIPTIKGVLGKGIKLT